MAIGSLDSIRKIYDGKRVVDDVSFDIEGGETLVLLGPSGSGKTTILRMIAGLEVPDSGMIQLDGRVVNAPSSKVPPDKRGISMVFQNLALWPHMTAAENIEFGLRSRGTSRSDRKRRVSGMLELVDLGDRGPSYPHELSGGEKQRVALARALVLEPRIVCFDEPLSDLDRELKEELIRKMSEIFRRLEITAVYVTHDQEEAMSLASRILVLNRGRTEQIAPPGEVYEAPASRFVASFVGMTNLMAGKVGDDGQIATPLGAVQAAPSMKAGSEVTIALRPESIRIDTSDGASGTAARVLEGTFRGNRWVYRVQVADRDFSAASPEPIPFGTDARLSIEGRPVILGNGTTALDGTD